MTAAPDRTTVSVALATYNGARFLDRQLASIAAQTRRPDEIVVGDDRSIDDTVARLERFGAQTGIAMRVTVNDARLGSTRNFERALGRCRGDVLLLSDQDDEWHPERVEQSLAALDARPDALYAFSDGALIDEQSRPLRGTLWGSAFFDARERALFRTGRGLDVLLRHNVVTGATLALRRRALDRVLPVAAGWIHDGWIVTALEALSPGCGILIEAPLVSYRWHAGQQVGTTGLDPARVRAFLRKQDESFFAREARNHATLRAHLVAAGMSASAPAVAALERKSEFLERRARMRRERWRALPVAVASWRRGDYARYAVGWKSAAMDLVPMFWRA